MRNESIPRTGICLLLAISILQAQSSSETRLSFEVASVKRAAPDAGPKKGESQGTVSISGGTLNMRNVSLKEMIQTAYGVKDHELSAPGWMKADRYDVVAKSNGPTANDQIRLMLQGLLADRFKLEVHRESKELAVMGMAVGKNRPKLGEAKPEGPLSIGIEQGKMLFRNYSMANLADYLSRHSEGRSVLDFTNIEGYYDFAVQVLDTPSNNPIDVKRAMEMESRNGSLVKTIVEGIGLRLETRKGPVEIVVVDRAEKFPTEN